MTKQDIKKIKICRAAIEKYRAFKQAYIKPEKEERVIVINDKGDRFSEKVEPERTAAALELNQVMKEQGFVNEKGEGSVAAFADWYNKLVLELWKKCRPIFGGCDLCGKKEFIDQPCVKYFGKSFCFPLASGINIENLYQLSLDLFRSGITKKNISDGKQKSFCKGSGGFYNDPSKNTEPPVGIDFGWRV